MSPLGLGETPNLSDPDLRAVRVTVVDADVPIDGEVTLSTNGSAVDRSNPLPVNETPVAVSSSYCVAGADNTAVVITLAGDANLKWCLGGICWSYDGDPSGGLLTITDNGALVFSIDITKSGPGFVPFTRPLKQVLKNTALVITLAAGGGTVEGTVTLLGAWKEA